MTVNHKFGPNCDARASQELWRPGGALASAFALIGLVVATTAAIAARAAIVSIAPATAAIYASVGMPVNLRGLLIADVRATVTEQADGQGELLVTGEIANLRDGETPAPDLRLALCGADGRELYVWTARPPKTRLGTRERVSFRARLAAPPAGVREVLVKFAEPGNKGTFTETPS
ncbi:MAG TPA: hypothetical protein VGG79_12735 [Roseiarcus sp.]|jgi:hypothetical protein